ncbi:MAG: hypothetical protein ACREXT_19125, partial [Gammaproteobacteria bacterium]
MKVSVLGNLLLIFAAGAVAQDAAPPDPINTEWLSYNGNVNGQRYADLNQINSTNALQLGEVCRLKVDDAGAFHSGILQRDGVLYFT